MVAGVSSSVFWKSPGSSCKVLLLCTTNADSTLETLGYFWGCPDSLGHPR